MNNSQASSEIDAIIEKQPGWKGALLSRLRTIILESDPDIIEEVKWKIASRPEGLPVWSHDGIVCIAETWKEKVVLIFFKGVHMSDPSKLFNARLKSSTDRAIEFHESDTVDEAGIRQLVLEAVEINKSKAN